ncbi:MAG: pyridoxamine 5'-phosphate oxidase family protein [Chloroflexota bacterium]
MKADEPAVQDVMRRSMVARIATLSRNGRPSITPLYFVCINGHLWLSTSDWTLAARDAKANPNVSILLDMTHIPHDHRILRIMGRANVQTYTKLPRSYVFWVALKYSLSPGGLRNNLAHLRQLRLMNRYHAQSKEKGLPCIIEVTSEQVEFLNDHRLG